ncbi:MAG TPA: DUF3616 domain-containing protein [Casimicrobiaceae bacterium]
MPAVVRGAALTLMVASGLAAAASPQASSYRGACDASAADALDAEHFVVASDEDNMLRIYRRGHPAPVGSVDLAAFLGTKKGEESDIEGAARIGAHIYWIASHGRNASGEARPARARLFATHSQAGDPPSVTAAGTPYSALLDDLTSSAALARYRLDVAARRAPEADGGLNIEGLAATPEGALLIGFRSPLVQQRALIVPLTNPADVIAGRRARLGTPIELYLGGRGIRDIARAGDGYVIVAGPTGDAGKFALYRWSGDAMAAPVEMTAVDIDGFNPEAIFAIPGASQLQLLSDDGGVKVGGVECKKLPKKQRAFRSLIFTP